MKLSKRNRAGRSLIEPAKGLEVTPITPTGHAREMVGRTFLEVPERALQHAPRPDFKIDGDGGNVGASNRHWHTRDSDLTVS